MDAADAQARLRNVRISPEAPISEALAQLDKAGTGALLLCEETDRLCGLLTDGDIRRAILQGRALSEPCGRIATLRPITATLPIATAEALRRMNEHDINHLPVIDREGRVHLLLLRADLVTDERPVSAVIMAGGFGTRLRPLTESVPKPMLPVGDRPLLELTIAQLRKAGIRRVSLTTHYRPDAIVKHFGDGGDFGVHLNYVHEASPLGTAGGLRMLPAQEGTLLVMNGDILTGVPFQEFLRYHRRYRADLTVGVRQYDIQVPFGVVECDGSRVTRLREKPSLSFFINAGAYLLEPAVCSLIPEGRRFDMTDLIQKLLDLRRTVVSFPILEYWLDIGRHEDYQRAQDDVLKGRI
jgi:dTDP-glucose pyrophosphorylase